MLEKFGLEIQAGQKSSGRFSGIPPVMSDANPQKKKRCFCLQKHYETGQPEHDTEEQAEERQEQK